MTIKNKAIGAAIFTVVFIGALFFTPLKESAPSESPLTFAVMILAILSLVCFIVCAIKAVKKKDRPKI
jgi:hypothetical protein